MSNLVASIVVDGILKEMEKGVAPWHKPWIVTQRQNIVSKKPYRGVNRLITSLLAPQEDYFITFLQAKQMGGQVVAGSKSLPVVFWSNIKDSSRSKQGKTEGSSEESKISNTDSDSYFMMRYYRIFKLCDIKGVDRPQVGTEKKENRDIEAFIQSTGASVVHGGSIAAFSPVNDVVEMPDKRRFDSEEQYYHVMFHELVHWTGNTSRLNRFKKEDRFGSEPYSKEELVAEIGAAMLCHVYGINLIPQNAAYMASWLKVLKNDNNMIISAASRAEKALDYLGVFKETQGEPVCLQ